MAKSRISAIKAAERMAASDAAYLANLDADRDATFEAFNRAEYEAEWGFAYEEGHRTTAMFPRC